MGRPVSDGMLCAAKLSTWTPPTLSETRYLRSQHWSAQASGQLAVRRERNAPEIGSAAVLLDKRDGVGGTSPGRFQLRNDPRRNLATILVSQLHDGASRKVTSQLHSRSV